MQNFVVRNGFIIILQLKLFEKNSFSYKIIIKQSHFYIDAGLVDLYLKIYLSISLIASATVTLLAVDRVQRRSDIELCHKFSFLGPVVQSIVSLTSSLRGQLIKCLTTLLLNTPKVYVEKMRDAFALQKLLTFFSEKILAYLRY